MDEDIFFWIKLTSFLLAMIVSFQVGRYYERFRLLRFLKKQGDRIEKVLDDFFLHPWDPIFRHGHGNRGKRNGEATLRIKAQKRNIFSLRPA